MAGDRGMRYPELTGSSLQHLDLPSSCSDGNPTLALTLTLTLTLFLTPILTSTLTPTLTPTLTLTLTFHPHPRLLDLAHL